MECENCSVEHSGSYGSGRFCSSLCARSFSTKKSRKEINRKVSEKLKRVHEITKTCAICESIFTTKYANKRTCSQSCAMTLRYQNPEQRKITSQSVVGKTGGWRNFGGNGKKGVHEGFIYQSSWELDWIKLHLIKNLPFRRCTEYFEYEYDGKMRKYFPDFFLLQTQEYVEVKGFPSAKTEAKINAVRNAGKSIRIISKKEILEIQKELRECG